MGEGNYLKTPLSDTLQHPLQVLKNFVIPKSQDAESIPGKTSIPLLISAPCLRMLSSVKFDDDPLFKRDEVNDIPFNRLLTTEFYAFHLAVP